MSKPSIFPSDHPVLGGVGFCYFRDPDRSVAGTHSVASVTGQLTEDEFFVAADAAKAGGRIENPSDGWD